MRKTPLPPRSTRCSFHTRNLILLQLLPLPERTPVLCQELDLTATTSSQHQKEREKALLFFFLLPHQLLRWNWTQVPLTSHAPPTHVHTVAAREARRAGNFHFWFPQGKAVFAHPYPTPSHQMAHTEIGRQDGWQTFSTIMLPYLCGGDVVVKNEYLYCENSPWVILIAKPTPIENYCFNAFFFFNVFKRRGLH